MLFGRDSELRRIGAVLADARAGRGGALVMSGEPGVGKSALLDYARAAAADVRVLAARGVEAESELPYAGLSQLLGPVMDRFDRLIPLQRDALLGALGAGPARPRDRFVAYVAILSLLAELAEERPVLALVDDAHWIDAASRDALAFLMRRLGSERLALLVAMRSGGASPIAPEPKAMAVRGLDGNAAVALMEAAAHTSIAEPVRERLHRESAGNPLALQELSRLLSPAQLAGAEPLPEPLPVGEGLVRAFGSQIRTLPQPARRALLIAATHGTGELGTLARALRSRGLDLSMLSDAEAAGLVHVDAGRLQFRHPLLRSASYHGAPPPARRDAHAALANALDEPSQRASRAWHLAAATLAPTEDVARELEAVAEDAHRRAAPTTAGRVLESAARLSTTGERRAGRLLAAGRAHRLSGDPAARGEGVGDGRTHRRSGRSDRDASPGRRPHPVRRRGAGLSAGGARRATGAEQRAVGVRRRGHAAGHGAALGRTLRGGA